MPQGRAWLASGYGGHRGCETSLRTQGAGMASGGRAVGLTLGFTEAAVETVPTMQPAVLPGMSGVCPGGLGRVLCSRLCPLHTDGSWGGGSPRWSGVGVL